MSAMDRRDFARAGLGAAAALAAASAADAAKADTGKAPDNAVVFQVSSEDRREQQLTLGNAHNYAAYYKAKNQPFEVEIVAFGPGFAIFRGDMSMMKGDVENLREALGASLTLSACHNTRAAIAESMGKKADDIPLLPGVSETPSGVVRVAELQRQGWAYVRP